jgi:hypothetical protein
MKKFWLATAAVVALSGSVFGDSIWTGSVGSLNTIPTTATFYAAMGSYPNTSSANAQIPFWNNPSSDVLNGDNHYTNVGDVLAGVSTGTNLIGSNLSGTPGINQTTANIIGSYFAYTATDNTAGGGDPVTTVSGTSATPSLEYSFSSTATAYNIAVLFADSTLDTGVAGSGTVFGYYTGSGVSISLHPIGNPISNNTTGTPQTIATNDVLEPSTTVYGFYATVCYQYIGGVCYESITYTTGAGNYSSNITSGNALLAGEGWNHFALFELANGEEVLGFEDSPWALGTANATEGEGDFNDVIIGLTSQGGVSAPEPGTIAIMGLGLAALGSLGRRRFLKK